MAWAELLAAEESIRMNNLLLSDKAQLGMRSWKKFKIWDSRGSKRSPPALYGHLPSTFLCQPTNQVACTTTTQSVLTFRTNDSLTQGPSNLGNPNKSEGLISGRS
ncbi:unnamed protein product [Ceratitis capitata]|uniref:(Mediterranean fruit fly) hypothetical protein n=1 Tax=Ceratitis capitata TaxID=7213 RepID=A0A811VIK7_CERCA|nr:unnamed protein product [Ceratitis capitata]